MKIRLVQYSQVAKVYSNKVWIKVLFLRYLLEIEAIIQLM